MNQRWSNRTRSTRPRVAYLSPLPPERSGIADYSRELLPYLAHHVDLVLYTERPDQVEPMLKQRFAVRALHRYPQERWEFTVPLYQMGNSQFHDAFYATLLRYPGLVVLHDYVMRHFIAYRTWERGDFSAYARESGYAAGISGLLAAHAKHLGQPAPALNHLPFNQRLLDSSLALVVHSSYVAAQVRGQGFRRPLTILPALIEAHPGQSRRAELQLPAGTVLFASYGLMTRQKQIERALRAFKRLRESFSEAHYLLVGESAADFDCQALIEELALGGAVTQVGYVSGLDKFVDWLHTADVVINLRAPTMGETSAVALRAMAAARPLIVFDQGWYAEIPAAAAIKVPPLDDEALLTAMLRLARSPELRRQMGEAGQRYAHEVCDPRRVAAAYARALSSFVSAYMSPDE